jgi:hypothetical protein
VLYASFLKTDHVVVYDSVTSRSSDYNLNGDVQLPKIGLANLFDGGGLNPNLYFKQGMNNLENPLSTGFLVTESLSAFPCTLVQ